MPINPQVASLLAMMAQFPPIDFETVTAAQWREERETMRLALGEPPAVAVVRNLDITLPGRTLPARLYIPENAPESPPLAIYFHGGGWVLGSIDTHDSTCRALARAAGVAILSVGYRLAPEAPFPAPLDDCFDALLWAHDHAGKLGIDPDRLAVAGDSAGGNLATAVALRARDRQGPALRHQLLIYPVTDADFTRPSYTENGDGDYFLSTAGMQWFWKQYCGALPQGHVEGATVLRTADLRRLPSATVVLAEYDPLRDEGSAYADALERAGNAVVCETVPGMIHGFFSMADAVPDALPAIERAGAALRKALS